MLKKRIEGNHASVEEAPTSELYDENYYRYYCGGQYERSEVWHNFFGSIAAEVIRSLKSRSVLDAGCAWGFLVEAFWDRGVEARGVDISRYAISQVRRDMQPFCKVASLTEPIEGRFDLITCIEVLEHMSAEHAAIAIGNLTKITDTILFSSSPTELTEKTHINVQPTMSWLKLFAEFGFSPDLTYDASFLAAHAMLLRRSSEPLSEEGLILFSEKIRLQVARAEEGQRIATLSTEAAKVAILSEELIARSSEIELLRTELNQKLMSAYAERDTAKEEADARQSENLCLQEEVIRAKGEADKAYAGGSELNERLASAREEKIRVERELVQANTREVLARSERMKVERQLQSAEADLIEARAKLEHLESELHQAKSQIERLQDEAIGLQATREQTLVDRERLLQSTTWRATAPVRKMVSMMPHSVRRFFRGLLRVIWWLFTPWAMPRRPRFLQARTAEAQSSVEVLPPSSPGTQDNLSSGEEISPEAILLAGSEFFDRQWYLTTYPDVAAAGCDPLLHYLRYGAAEGRDPGPQFSTRAYLDRYPSVSEAGLNPLVHYLRYGLKAGLDISPLITTRTPSTDDILRRRFFQLEPLPVFFVPDTPRRVTMVTDSISAGSLYGGVGTAMILSALLAERFDSPLRIVTRTERPEHENLLKILQIQGVPLHHNVEFVHSDVNGVACQVDVGRADLFVTTSWWTTHAVRRSVASNQIIYLVQEDERMFYPHGDDKLFCRETLSDCRLRFVVNSQLLFEHFAAEGLKSIVKHGVWFEPAFPEAYYYYNFNEAKLRRKLNFFFYARPSAHISRNLYYRGIEAIDASVARGVLDPNEWDFTFVGKDLCELTLAGAVKPVLLENLEWSDYTTVVRRTDLGLSLMYTPHPSYPPLDLAASGAIAVTNKFGVKTSLTQYSRNIICSDLDVDSLVKSIAEGAALARDGERRRANYERNALSRDWRLSFKRALESVAGG